MFNNKKFYVLPTVSVDTFYMALRTNSTCYPVQHLSTGFCNRGRECLMCGRCKVFNCKSLKCRAVTQAVIDRPVTAEALVRLVQYM